MSRKFIIDIETVPRPDIMDTWFPQWASNKYPNVYGDALEDCAALHAEFGMICCISYVGLIDSSTPTILIARNLAEEKNILEDMLPLMDSESVIWIGHNLKGFDIPFMAKRFMVQCGFVPRSLNFGGKKPWEIPHIDTMEMMRFGGGASMSLRSACLMLGIDDPKDNVCGSEVPQLFREGKLDVIGQYCAGDVVAERELYKRIDEALG